MVITKENFIERIANKEDMDAATVRKIFKSAEDIIFACLSSTSPSENTIIKLLDGLRLECTYIPETTIHRYDDVTCKSHIRAKAKITRHYNRKLNKYFK